MAGAYYHFAAKVIISVRSEAMNERDITRKKTTRKRVLHPKITDL
jgi:hypothetical protein